MSEKYRPVRARLYSEDKYIGTSEGNLYLEPQEGADVRVTEESQLYRIEKKLDEIILRLDSRNLYIRPSENGGVRITKEQG
ncbi:hypothetical protein [Oceanobacillus sojae]|uniref:hypothetical protein n=1 Tax=Oceanobacillus sojae TaxID=582851 RepID=UPI0021A53B42|nr:hypothetical protein [Oceanobacillus sojae]MCT1904123.1 hypothetical protein [Oceanobacillus sojae]